MLHPDWFYREAEGGNYFGFKPTQLAVRIKAGDIPKPVSLSESGRSKGWFGRTIIAWQQQREAKQRAA
jgi:predicted DNA-binding transcriptional regulator AlpA